MNQPDRIDQLTEKLFRGQINNLSKELREVRGCDYGEIVFSITHMCRQIALEYFETLDEIKADESNSS